MQASRFPPGQLLFGSLVVAGSVGSGPSVPDVVPVGAAVGGSVGGRVVESGQIRLMINCNLNNEKVLDSIYPNPDQRRH